MDLQETLKWKKEKKKTILSPGESTVSLYKVLFFLALIIIYNLQDTGLPGILLKRGILNVGVRIRKFLVLII